MLHFHLKHVVFFTKRTLETTIYKAGNVHGHPLGIVVGIPMDWKALVFSIFCLQAGVTSDTMPVCHLQPEGRDDD